MKTMVLFTGGTISMKVDSKSHATVLGVRSHEILDGISNLPSYGDIEILEFGDYAGPHITIDVLIELAKIVQENLLRDDIGAIVITHGTDTLEETAYFLDLIIQSEKPIVVVGAMRNSSEMGYDGPSNLAGALVAAKSPDSKGRGVLIVLNNEVNSAREVTKSNTLSLNTFQSLDFGPLGIIDNNEVLYFRKLERSFHIQTKRVEKEVYLIKSYLGMQADLLEYYIQKGAKGLVIEAMGRGNLPPSCVPAIKKAIQKSITVVIVSRCPSGRVLPTYGYEGGGHELQKLGALFGENINGQKMRIKLMLTLGYTQDSSLIKKIIEEKNIA